MPYYIKNGRVVEFANNVLGGTALTTDELNFYNANINIYPDLTVAEVQNQELNIRRIKSTKEEELKNAFETALVYTYNNDGFNFTLTATDNVIDRMTKLGAISNNPQQTNQLPVVDDSLNVNWMTVSQLQTFRAGFDYAVLNAQLNYESKLRALAEATTVVQVNAITWS